jgi:small-conductance mechanosensitive channel
MPQEIFEYAGIIVLILVVASISVLLLRKVISVIINRRYGNNLKGQTNISFIKNSISFVVYFLALVLIFIQIPPLKSLGENLFAGAGILAAIVGFASQKAFSNIISGVFIILFRPFSVGDTIEPSSGRKGVVEEITLRHIVIRDYENRRIVIPNSSISDDVIVNSTISDEKIRVHVPFSISYDSDVDLARKLIKEEAEKHPFSLDNRDHKELENNDPIVDVIVLGLGDFSVNLRAYVWVEDNDHAFTIKNELFESVKKRFDKEGVEIPFPYRTLVMKKDIEDKKNNSEKK